MDTGADDPGRPPQGWFVDPFGSHEQRWFSQGAPTALVRDGRTETQDPPPEGVVDGPLIRAVPLPPRRTGVEHVPAGGDRPGEPAESSTAGRADPGPRPHPGASSTPFRARPVPSTPKRVVGPRWVAFGFAVVWSLLLIGLLVSATTTTRLPDGHTHTQSVVGRDPAGVMAVAVLLVVALAVCGVGLVRRLRAHSEAPSRPGYVFAGILCLLGVLSLATTGFTLIILGAALFVVARPLKRPRPLPGEQVN